MLHDIKLITIENSEIVFKTVARCRLENYDRSLHALAKEYFGSNWEYRKETPDAIVGYVADTQTGNVLSI